MIAPRSVTKWPRGVGRSGPIGFNDRHHFSLSHLLRFGCLTVSFLGGCSTPGWLCLRPPGPNSATIIADPDANNTSAIAVDLLFISDSLAAQQISVLTATDYFARRAQLQRDFPGGLLIWSRELAPGQIARDMPLNPNCNRVRTLLFARYLTPGDHRQSVANVSRIVVTLGREDFIVSR